MLVACEALYGPERAAELCAFLEGITGEPCPVWHQHDDPLPPPDLPAPRSVSSEVGALRTGAAVVLAGYGLSAMKLAAAAF